MILQQDHFALANFEGTLDVLLFLLQKEEIDIYDIPIQELMQQFIRKLAEWEHKQLDKGAEFIGAAAYLVWLKSKTLLPTHEQSIELEEKLEDPHFEIIHHLMDYCRFKQAGKRLVECQEKQQACYFRCVEAPQGKKPLGIDHLSLDELYHLFEEMMKRAALVKPQIQEEQWRVSDKLSLIRHWLQKSSCFPFSQLFYPEQSRLEMIVSFLAILELMKIGEAAVRREETSTPLMIFAKDRNTEQ